MKVEIFSRRDCGLCDEAKAVIEEVRRRNPFDLVEVDVDADPALAARYGSEVPVVFVDGRKAFKHRLTAEAFARRLNRSA